MIRRAANDGREYEYTHEMGVKQARSLVLSEIFY